MNIKQKFVASATAASMAISLFAPFAVAHALAGEWKTKSDTYLKGAADSAGMDTAGVAEDKLPKLIGKLIGVVLSLLGLIFLGLALYAGFKWMTAQGDSKEVDGAKDTLKNAVIGMIIVAASYALSTFIMGQLLSAVS